MAEEAKPVGQNAAECSHQDASRKTVSVTAHGVAYMRGLEPELCPDSPLFSDPYAAVLGGEVGKQWAEGVAAKFAGELTAKTAFYSSVAVRTKKIDSVLQEIIFKHHSLCQICTLGAGLDTRPWRLQLQPPPLGYFELDFSEIFEYKLPILEAHKAHCPYLYRHVAADLSLPTWPQLLQEGGLDCTRPTVWLLEGLTGYLTQEENERMFCALSSLSAPGSYVVATFITPPAKEKLMLSLHRYAPEDPLQLLRSCGGWEGEAIDLLDTAKEYNRVVEDDRHSVRGYMLVIAHI